MPRGTLPCALVRTVCRRPVSTVRTARDVQYRGPGAHVSAEAMGPQAGGDAEVGGEPWPSPISPKLWSELGLGLGLGLGLELGLGLALRLGLGSGLRVKV